MISKITKEDLINQHKLQMSRKATGIDMINKTEYGKNLEQNIEELLRKMKNFSYKPMECPIEAFIIYYFHEM